MYKFYLEKVKVPTPGKLEIKVKGANKVIRLANDGEMNLIRQPGLTEFKFKILLPMIGAEKSPDFYIKYLENLMTSGKPFRFIVNRTDGYTKEFFSENLKLVGNTAVTLESFEIVEDANNGTDVEVAIVLKKYDYYATKEVALQLDESSSRIVQVKSPFRSRPESSSKPKPPQDYVATPGDTKINLERKYGKKINEAKSNALLERAPVKFSWEKIAKKSGGISGVFVSEISGISGKFTVTEKIKSKPSRLGAEMKKLRKSGKYRGSR